MTDIFHVSDQGRDAFLKKAGFHDVIWEGLVVNLLTFVTPYCVQTQLYFYGIGGYYDQRSTNVVKMLFSCYIIL